MPSALTQEQLTKTLQTFKGELHEGLATKKDLEGFATKKDLEGLATKKDLTSLETRMATKDDLLELGESMTKKYSDLQMSVDRYLKFTESWHQELTILKGRQDRLSQVLIDKGVVSEKDLALLA